MPNFVPLALIMADKQTVRPTARQTVMARFDSARSATPPSVSAKRFLFNGLRYQNIA